MQYSNYNLVVLNGVAEKKDNCTLICNTGFSCYKQLHLTVSLIIGQGNFPQQEHYFQNVGVLKCRHVGLAHNLPSFPTSPLDKDQATC